MEQRIEIINNWTIAKVFGELENGNMRIPRFQRAYVWERSKIVKLLNSIYNQYPIGSFFLWDTDRTLENFCRDITEFGFPKKPEANKFSFILDGQQRITSLYVALKGLELNGVNYKTICYNLDKKIFKILTLKTEPNNIPAWKIYNNVQYGELLKEYFSAGKIELGSAIQQCHDALCNYPVSIIKSLNMELDEVVTIFERINQGGKRLSLFDLVHASVWSGDFDLRDKIGLFNSGPSIKLFGGLGAELFTQSLAMNVKNDCTNRHQLDLQNDECRTNWKKTAECLSLAIDYVKKNMGVQRIDIIPYPSQIPIIQHYFFVSGKKSIDANIRPLILEWFWTVSFSQRYSSSTLTRMNEDAAWIRSLVNGELAPRRYTVKLSIEDLKKVRMNTRSVIKNAILCLMAMNDPKDFDNGDEVTLDNTNASRSNSKENHHFFPYSLHSAFNLSQNDINCVLNFAFISKRLNLEILNNAPAIYLKRYENSNSNILEHLSSHYIDEKAFNAAKNNDFVKFIDARGSQILNIINKICSVGSDSISFLDDYDDNSSFEEDTDAED